VALLGVLVGILVAVLLSLGDFVRRAWRPHDAVLGPEDELKGYHDLERHPNARQIPGLLLYRFDAPLFFANADYFRRRISDLVATTTPRIRWVVVAASPSPTWTPPPPTRSWSCSASYGTRRWCLPSPS